MFFETNIFKSLCWNNVITTEQRTLPRNGSEIFLPKELNKGCREHFTRFSPLQEINFMINVDSGRLEDNNMILS